MPNNILAVGVAAVVVVVLVAILGALGCAVSIGRQ